MTSRRRRADADPAARFAQAEPRPCALPNCRAHGLYPAPRSRTQFKPYLWFCLEHVRAYNAGWDFYSGMSPDEIEREIRRDTVWRRPSWPLGENKLLNTEDIFGLFGEAHGGQKETAVNWGLTPEAAAALVHFSLSPPVTLVDIKARYKQLVKENHPDSHGGDRAFEEKLKIINLAYDTLVQFFGGDLRP